MALHSYSFGLHSFHLIARRFGRYWSEFYCSEEATVFNHARRAGRLVAQAVLLSVIYLASSAFIDLLQIPLPSNLLALLLLLVLLASGVLRLAYVEELATFLLRHLTSFSCRLLLACLPRVRCWPPAAPLCW